MRLVGVLARGLGLAQRAPEHGVVLRAERPGVRDGPGRRAAPLRPGRRGGAPRGWHGRWDITEHIHKIWLTHTHEDKQGASKRPTTAPFARLVESLATSKSAGRSGVAAYDDADGFRAGVWALPAHGEAIVTNDANAIEVFTVVKGELFVVDFDGAVARRCVPGDVVFLPEGWRGSLRGGDARAEAAAVSVAGSRGTPSTSIGSNVTTASSPASSRGAERDEMYDPENETRGRR